MTFLSLLEAMPALKRTPFGAFVFTSPVRTPRG